MQPVASRQQASGARIKSTAARVREPIRRGAAFAVAGEELLAGVEGLRRNTFL